jgi:hypothetical protein
MQHGLLYIPLNEKGERAGHPFKASLFGKSAGLPTLELHFVKCKMALKDHPTKHTLKAAITILIDHNSKAVWNGSRLSTELSANIFNDYWNNNIKLEMKEAAMPTPRQSTSNDADLPVEEPHHLFNFLTTDKHEDGLIEALGGLLPEAQGEDYEEQDFANKMKKRKRRRKQ